MISSFNILPSFPFPGTLTKSILFSRAIFLTAGVASTLVESADTTDDVRSKIITNCYPFIGMGQVRSLVASLNSYKLLF